MSKQKHDIGHQKRLKNKAEKRRLEDLKQANWLAKNEWKKNR